MIQKVEKLKEKNQVKTAMGVGAFAFSHIRVDFDETM